MSEQRQKARSEQVCRDILGSGESFEQLDAHRWLSELESGAEAAVSRCDCIPKLICPWRRYFARSLDLMLCRVVPALLIVSVFRLNVDLSNWFLRILMLAVGMTVMFVVEPFLLRFFGTTPGKWMLGLSVESVDGGRLSLAEARERTSGVLWKGLGLSVPGVEQATLITSCYKHSKGEELSWERGSELRLDRAGWRVGLYAAVVLLVLGLSVVTAMETQMPRHRGDITAEEFCDNYNSLARFHGIHTDGIRLTTNGWIDTDHSKTFGGFDGDAVRYIFTEEDGELRGSYLTGTEEDPATLNMRFTVEFENEETRTDN